MVSSSIKKKAFWVSAAVALVFGLPTLTHAASISVSPGAATQTVGQSFTATIVLNTEGVAANAVEGVLSFDPAVLTVKSVSKTGSIVQVWVQEPTFSNTEGKIDFGGIILNPGYTGSKGTLLKVTLAAKATGNTQLTFASGSVLANDGTGRNITSGLNGATYSIQTAPTATATPATQPTTVSPLTLTFRSATHPDQASWYNNRNPLVAWDLPQGVTQVRLILSTHTKATPTIRYTPPISEKQLSDLEDGTWYLHGQLFSQSAGGPVATFRLNIDSTPPEPFAVTVDDRGDPTQPQPDVLFSTTDRTSGLERYDIRIDAGTWTSVAAGSVSAPYRVSPQLPGHHTVAVVALDKAGNETVANAGFSVSPLAAPRITSAPMDGAKAGERFAVGGTSFAGAGIRLFALPAGSDTIGDPRQDMFFVGDSTAATDGAWTLGIRLNLAGTYRLVAFAHDARGAYSDASDPVTILVKPTLLSVILEFLVNLFTGILHRTERWFIPSLLTYVALLVIVATVIFRRRPAARTPALSKTSLAITPATVKKLRELVHDVDEEILLLKHVAKHRPLYPEEKYLQRKLVQYRATLKGLFRTTKK